jgi:hypothetical protein
MVVNTTNKYIGGVLCMDKVTLDNITIENLDIRINSLRDVLNEICCTELNDEVNEQRLLISRELDELIVKYMKELGS